MYLHSIYNSIMLNNYYNMIGGKIKRCPKGSRKNKKTNKCEKQNDNLKKKKILKKTSVYAPYKYFEGLDSNQTKKRLKRIKEGSKTKSNDKNSYRKFETDYNKNGTRIKTKLSGYTKQWKKVFPEANSLEDKAEVTGVPLKNIKKVYDKGLAAWRTGHRPGANSQQWGYARVHSFLVKGKTFYTSDRAQAIDAMKNSKQARDWYQSVEGLCDGKQNKKKNLWCEKACQSIDCRD